MATRSQPKLIEPVRPIDCKLAEHAFRTHAVILRRETRVTCAEDLLNPVLYEHISRSIRAFDQVQFLDEAGAFWANVLVTFAQGSMVRVSILQFVPLDTVDLSSMDTDSDYEIRLRGPLRWCIIKRSTGETVKENLPDKAKALQELMDIRKAMAA